MRIFDILKNKYECTLNLREQRLEEKRVQHNAQVECEKARIQGILDSEIPWDYVIELECEHADENDDVCYLGKCIMCEVARKDIWNQKEVKGIIVSGDDFGKNIILNVGEDFYGKKQVSFWDNFDYLWYGYGKQSRLSSKPFKTIAELNDYMNSYNQKRLDRLCEDYDVKTQV